MQTDLIGAVVQLKWNETRGVVRAIAFDASERSFVLLVEFDGDQLKAIEHTDVNLVCAVQP